MKIHLRTFPDAIKEFLLSPLIIIGPKFGLFTPAPKPILQNFNGVARPGEMVLVLGRPGSGCSTFLKAIANQREGYLAVDGEVTYAGIPADEFKKRFAGEVAYNAEDDMHHATLTVEQTLDFALRTKTPGKRVPGQSREVFRQQVIDTLLKMLNIEHTRKTLVGNEFVRGVSGGERKRVSIAEMFATRAVVASWDNSTRGLDASTALDYAKSLRVITDVFQMVNFVSLYQAGEGIYEQFDKVLVIDEGRQVYFGPASEARQYFLGLGFRDLPRQTTADYLTGCTDPHERQYADGRSEEDVPSTSEALERAFRDSQYWKRLVQERDNYRDQVSRDASVQEEFRLAVKESKGRYVRSTSVYQASFFTQIKACEFSIALGDRRRKTHYAPQWLAVTHNLSSRIGSALSPVTSQRSPSH
jgi:ATP-binding cassette subfamily G (WHITE) protein 2 (SNQ2)